MSRAYQHSASFVLALGALTYLGCESSVLFSDSPPLSGTGGSGGTTSNMPGAGGSPVGPGPGGAAGSGNVGGQGMGGQGGEGGEGGSDPECGNGVQEQGEMCDGFDLAGSTCSTFNFSNPLGLTCDDNCEFDASGCTTTCDGVLEPTEPCDDGNDNPNDGCDECMISDPVGTCGNAIAVAVTTSSVVAVSGTTVGGGSQTTNQCQNEVGASDIVYEVTPAEDGFLTAYMSDVDATYDSLLYAMRDCADLDSGILCVDNFPNGKETISFEVEAMQTYYLVVDGFGGAEGNYTLNMDLSKGTCADPIPFPLYTGAPMDLTGDTTGDVNDAVTSGCGGSQSPDVVYELMPMFDGKAFVDIIPGGTNYDSVLSARTTCDDQMSQITCDHVNGPESLELDVLTGTSVFILVDGFGLNPSAGNYYVQVTPQ